MKHLYQTVAILLLSILSSTASIGQNQASIGSAPESTAIQMPELERYSFIKKDDIILKDTRAYHELFSEHEVDKLPVVDFEKNYLHGSYVCHSCLNCPPEFQQCHRSACSYLLKWLLIEYK